MAKAPTVHTHNRKIHRWGIVFIPLWIAIAVLFAGMAAADSFWHLRLGFDWSDAVTGIAFAASGCIFLAIWIGMDKLTRRLNTFFFGPEDTIGR
jgi:hypothetical protein